MSLMWSYFFSLFLYFMIRKIFTFRMPFSMRMRTIQRARLYARCSRVRSLSDLRLNGVV